MISQIQKFEQDKKTKHKPVSNAHSSFHSEHVRSIKKRIIRFKFAELRSRRQRHFQSQYLAEYVTIAAEDASETSAYDWSF